MGKMSKIYLCGDRIYSCSTCRTHLAKHDQIVSKVCALGAAAPHAAAFRLGKGCATDAIHPSQAFQGRHGRAFLFSNV